MTKRWLVELYQRTQLGAFWLNQRGARTVREQFAALGFTVVNYDSGYYNPTNWHRFYISADSDRMLTVFRLRYDNRYDIKITQVQ